MDSMNDINEARFTLWVKKADGKKEVALPVGKVVFPTNLEATVRANDDEWYSIADASLEDKGTIAQCRVSDGIGFTLIALL